MRAMGDDRLRGIKRQPAFRCVALLRSSYDSPRPRLQTRLTLVRFSRGRRARTSALSTRLAQAIQRITIDAPVRRDFGAV